MRAEKAQNSKRASESLSKASAGDPAPSDSAITLFNIILRTKDRTGSLAFGFKYDSTAKTFTRTVDGATLKRFDLRPKPLVRYSARIAREPVHGADGRVFVPGTPFQATLVDSLFVLQDMPEGQFPLRLLAADGKVIGVLPNDPRLSVVWRVLEIADTLPHPLVPPKPDTGLRKSEITDHTVLRTEVAFGAEGLYEFELRATIGLRTQADTVSISVTRKPPTIPGILLPHPNDTLRTNHSYVVQWILPDPGPVTVSVSLDSGRAWIDLVKGYTGKDRQPGYPWIPSSDLGSSDWCLLRIRSDADSTKQAVMTGTFYLTR